MRNNKGISLIAVVVIMLLVATLTLMIASTISTGNISSVTDMHALQAFYLAQAGMEWYMEQLENDSDWSSPPAVKTDQSFGAGTFSVSYANETVDSIDITATGKVTGWSGNDVQRVITQHVEKSASGGTTFADFVIFFGGGDGSGTTTMDKNQTITGDTFVNDDLEIGKNCTITGDVSATGSITVGSGTNISGDTTEYADAPANQPTLTTTYYDGLITTASGEPSGDVTYNNDTLSGTDYINGDVRIKNTLSGSGTIVATGQIRADKNAVITDDITLICTDTLKINKNGTVGKNVTLYSTTKVQVDDGVVLGSGAGSEEGTVLLSPDTVRIQKNVTIVGVIFGDEVDINKKNFTLTGNLCGDSLSELDNGAVLTLDSTKVDHGSIEGFDAGEETEITTSLWQESL